MGVSFRIYSNNSIQVFPICLNSKFLDRIGSKNDDNLI